MTSIVTESHRRPGMRALVETETEKPAENDEDKDERHPWQPAERQRKTRSCEDPKDQQEIRTQRSVIAGDGVHMRLRQIESTHHP